VVFAFVQEELQYLASILPVPAAAPVQPKPKMNNAPPTVSTKGGKAPGRGKVPVFKSREEVDDWFMKDGFTELEL